ncbi:hypothetical protein ABI_08480 [Asticcacaulis biprosthecium C19]|uniref:Phage tail protein n=1 Tax=Asticcacaulis biprosthecium C19 TaxID=715226 RepID=F4QG84_9CAUL|nr:putative phage tail protein [Asticcacaulis biprosthecium]EGF92412.1 hypothetical protein ABI_08480 [Asticcacaulis biprosthecium C19]
MDAPAYLDQLLKLLPRGRAWSRAPESTLSKLMSAFADGAARFDARALELLEEADPRTTTELIDAWERVAGLPDTCTGTLTEIADRRAALWQKLTNSGGQSIAYFTEVAARLGYEIEITLFRPMYCTSPCTGLLFTTAWRFTWQVTVANAEEAPVMECVFNRLKPAETAVFFVYEG